MEKLDFSSCPIPILHDAESSITEEQKKKISDEAERWTHKHINQTLEVCYESNRVPCDCIGIGMAITCPRSFSASSILPEVFPWSF